jgi:tRNA-Thr(GGU) m(6)t(6)A37 methyltransferase TsaA
MSITYKPIGIVHSPFKKLEGMPIQPAGAVGITGTIEIFKEYEAGLKDLDGFSHLIVLFHLHRSKGYKLQVIPYLDDTPRGVFATRAPKRPNAIGLSVVQLIRITGRKLRIECVDMLDQTPVLDLKPYVPAFDTQGRIRTGWLEKVQNKVSRKQADQRFLKE